ncbi:hypothetical protein [uncultured Methylobacterium sp.]|uniref:hypothetical protein n=1 Tax=uncultured Methylobacterium sp. TaxID=157278 RepID=UPI0026381121|nr:hypothetical protein [uncultured Methylobacterium sp.]
MVVEEAGRAATFEVTREGLKPIGTEAALRLLGAGEDALAEYRLASRSYALRLGAKPERHRFAEPHGLAVGVQPWPIPRASSYVYVERVTALQAWVRRPTLAEVRGAGFDVT